MKNKNLIEFNGKVGGPDEQLPPPPKKKKGKQTNKQHGYLTESTCLHVRVTEKWLLFHSNHSILRSSSNLRQQPLCVAQQAAVSVDNSVVCI